MPLLTVRAIDAHKPKVEPYKLTLDRGLQLPAAFEHFNEVHPHSSLKMKSPREFRRQRVEQLRRAQPEQPALHCV